MPLFRTNYSTADEAMVAYTREQEEARAADDKRIKSLQQVYSNMKFFDMLQLISSRYNDLVFDERQAATSNNNTGVSDFVKNPNTLPKRIIEILNTYRVKTFDVEDKGTLFVGTFRTMITRAGWWSEVTIGKFVNITPNLTVEYREGSDIMKFPCAKVELFPIKVKEIGGTYKTPVIELAEMDDLNSYCILTDRYRPTVLTDKHCNDTRMYEPHEPGLYMMFFHLNDNNYQKILSAMKDVVTDLPDAVKQKTDMRRKAFETAIGKANGTHKDKLTLISRAFSGSPIGSDYVGYLPTHPTDKDTIPLLQQKPTAVMNPDDVDLLEGHPGKRESKIDKEGGILPLLKKRGFGVGGKLRSAKKTSKRRSVKSKPRYYRRSVGSINHRRKKTTRRRQ